jgi:hypothetical protein
VKASARFVSTVNRFGFGCSKVGRAATPFASNSAKGTGARSSRHPLALATTLLASVAVVFAVAAPAASAAPTAQLGYGYLTTGEFGAGELHGLLIGATSNPIALDSHGNVLIADQAGGEPAFNPGLETLALFAPDPTLGGTPLTKQPLPGTEYPTDIAVDPGTDALYVQGLFSPTIKRYLSDGNPTPTYTLDPSFEVPSPNQGQSEMGIAVDPTTHDLLVTDIAAQAIRRYSPTGGLIDTIGVPFFKNEGTAWIAVAPDGTIYVSQQANTKILHISAAGTVLGEIATGGEGTFTVNPSTGVLVAARGNHLKGYSPTDALLFETLMPVENLSGIQIDSDSGRLYAYNGEHYPNGGAVYTFVPAAYPGVEAPVVSNITPTGVHVSAEVDPGEEPGGGLPEESELCFEYKLASAANWGPGSCQNLSGPETKETNITGLEPNLDYVVRAQARNSKAGNLYASHTSDPTPFHTPLSPPLVHTGLAGGITNSGAQLTGTIATYGDQTTYHFEYGLTTNYGSSAPAGAEGVAGNERASRTFTRTLTGLQPATEYHYRLVAHNSAGEAKGEDLTFTTVGTDEVAPGRAYEQVTPVDKRGSSLRVETFQTSADGSGIVYAAAAASSDGESGPVLPIFLSRRGASDWSDWQQLDPPLKISRAIVGYATQAVSADLNHAFVVSNRVLVPGAIEDGANVYIRNLQTGAYTLIGSAEGLSAYISMNGVLPPNNYLAGAPDFSWVILDSRFPLLPGVTGAQVYKWTQTEGLELASRLPGPNGGGVPDAELTGLPGKDTLRWPVASDDGNTIYFSLGGADGGVYRRENGQTKAISVSEIAGDPATPAPGQFDGTSRDGRYGFFRSVVPLTTDAPSGGTSLYRYDAVTEDLTYIGPAVNTDFARVIGNSDDGQTIYWNGGDGTYVWRDGVSHLVTAEHVDAGFKGMNASLSKSGRYLAYLDEGEQVQSAADDDVWLYDADADQSVCVSCRPDGSPGGTADLQLHDRSLGNRVPQVLTDDGTVFFDTSVPLVPADHNGTRDVYSYNSGVLTLISPGDGNFTATFADASADGSNVFFVTDESLVNQDTDGELDIYDARIGGGFPAQSPPAPPAPCLRSECGETESGLLSSPPVASSQSRQPTKARKHCPKGNHARKVKGKTRCVKPSKHKNKAHRANNNRRQGR